MNRDRSSDSSPTSGERRTVGTDHLPVDEVHHYLASARRRWILAYLTTRSEETLSVDELVDVVTNREPPSDGPGTHRERVEIDLHHVQLPKLATAGILEYDPVEETVEYSGTESLEALLAVGEQLQPSDDAEGDNPTFLDEFGRGDA